VGRNDREELTLEANRFLALLAFGYLPGEPFFDRMLAHVAQRSSSLDRPNLVLSGQQNVEC
jgi:hypothetical protein